MYTECIYAFHTIPSANSNYFSKPMLKLVPCATLLHNLRLRTEEIASRHDSCQYIELVCIHFMNGMMMCSCSYCVVCSCHQFLIHNSYTRHNKGNYPSSQDTST
jgi:hypothetical protein